MLEIDKFETEHSLWGGRITEVFLYLQAGAFLRAAYEGKIDVVLKLIEEEGVPVNVENQVSDSEADRRGGSTCQCGEPGK